MLHAYNERYIDDAMNNLGDAMEYVVKNLKMSKSEFIKLFIASGIADEFGNGNPKYVLGMSGVELVKEVIELVGLHRKVIPFKSSINKSSDYWCGWILAYYQWKSKRPFSNIMRYVTMEDIEAMYSTYHEAPEEKFCDTIEKLINNEKGLINLQIIRKNCGITQRELADLSGVSIRSIQMYEQRNKDINKAQLMTVNNLAKVLGCKMEDLMEY